MLLENYYFLIVRNLVIEHMFTEYLVYTLLGIEIFGGTNTCSEKPTIFCFKIQVAHEDTLPPLSTTHSELVE